MASEGVPKVQKTMCDTAKVRSLTRKEWTTPGWKMNGEFLPTSVEDVRQARPPAVETSQRRCPPALETSWDGCGASQARAGALEGLSRRLHKVLLASYSNEHRKISLLSHARHCDAVAWMVEWKKRRLSVGHFGVLGENEIRGCYWFAGNLVVERSGASFFGVNSSYFSFPLDPAWWCWRTSIWAS